jgi:anti-repressor protein
MNELIKIQTNENGQAVSARELHERLGISKHFTDWFKQQSERLGLTEGEGFITFRGETSEIGGRPSTDYIIPIDIAKHLAMISGGENAYKIREYFIQVEKAWNSPEMVMARGLQMANKRIEGLTLQLSMKDQIIKELKPKADYTDSILKNKGLVTITQIAKDYGMSGQEMNELLHDLGVQYKQSGQWLLYLKYHDKGYTHSETIDITRSDGRPDVKMNTKWTQKGRLFIYTLLRKHDILPLIEQEILV